MRYIKTTTDLVVLVFVALIAVVLLVMTGVAVWESLFANREVQQFFSFITDLMTTLVAAIIGYIAGKGSERANGKEGR